MRLLTALAVNLIAIVSAAADEPIAISAVGLDLNWEDPSQSTLGRLEWRGSIELQSADPRFGGFSGLLVSADGRELTAVSDEGHWLTARIMLDEKGFLKGLAETRMGALLDSMGRPLMGKETADAESMTRWWDGSVLVGFEREHRIWRYPAQARPLTGLPVDFPPPPQLERLNANSGLEALVALPPKRLVTLVEDAGPSPTILGFLRPNGVWSEIALTRVGQFRPTGATTLPNGDLLVLERRFSILGGLGIRIRRIKMTEIRSNAVLEGEALAEFRPPIIYDNMEGIAVHAEPSEPIRIYLISDDNKDAFQRTMLMSFLLPDGAD